MIIILTYLAKVLFCSGILYGYYALALKNSPLHHWNRGYLLLAALAAFGIPLLQLPAFSQPMTAYATAPLITLREFIVNSKQPSSSFPQLFWFLCGVYSLITGVLLIKILLNWYRIKQLIRSGEIIQHDQYQLVKHPEVFSPFSFFNYIFWHNTVIPDSKEGRQILGHELMHIQGRHSTDKVFMEVICAFCWFNPFFYLIKRELGMVHEFIADKAAAEEGALDDYAHTLLQMTLQTNISLAINNFAQAPVKRRILMLFTHKTTHTIMKKTIIIPITLLLILFIGSRPENTVMANSQLSLSPAATEDTTIYTIVDQTPTFPGGEEALAKFLSKNIHYPKQAQEKNIQGIVTVTFVVTSDGSLDKIKTVGKVLGGGLEEESIRVVQIMPNWNPGKQKGKVVSVAFNLPIRYSFSASNPN
jgi:TonB family protein